MKKRVRVYKAGGESNQPTQEQIVNYISQRMSADDFDGDTDALKAELAQAGIAEDNADEYISYVSDNLGLDNNAQSDEAAQLAAEDQARAEEEQAVYEQQLAEEEAAAQQAQQEAMYNVEVNPEDTEDTPEDEATYMRQGGTNLSKRSFIKQYTKFAKMAQGGNTPSPGSNDVLNGRESHVKDFLGAVRNTANDAMLREEAEAQYNSAYGAPQVGAFQEGGIHQEEVDFENPLHHLSAYGADTRHIFSDDMYTQNDVAAMEQFGGNTGQGLYKFIGGGDNESADEEYQDADIDFNQEQYQMGGFRMPKRSGRQYTQAVGSPYYTTTGQAANPVDLANRKVTSVNVTKRGIFGRPKAYTVNYDGSTSATPAATPTTNPVTRAPGEYTGPDEFTGRRQPLANWMMRTGIPGVRGLGAKMIKSGPAPVVPNVIPETFGTESGKYNYKNSGITKGEKPINETPEIAGTQRRDSYGNLVGNVIPETFGSESGKYNFKTSAITNPIPEKEKPSMLKYANPAILENAAQMETAKAIKDLQSQSRTMREYGGPVDYTQYAYGGDIAVPELYRAQQGMQVGFDPNANNMNISNLQGFFDKPPTKDVAGNEITATVPANMQPDNITIDPNEKIISEPTQQRQGTSEDYLSKKNWDKTRDNFALGSMALNAGLDIADQVRARKQENQMLANTTAAESNYGISNQDDRGDYDPNSGKFRPDQTGFKSKYGGGIYATGGSTEDEDEDVNYMTQEEIDEFIANGGELEYL